MEKKITLITRRFPYFKTEAFLESEIIVLSEYFDKVIIYPTEISNEMRKLPANVEVVNDFSYKFQNKPKRALKTFFSRELWKAFNTHKSKISNINDCLMLYKFMTSVVVSNSFFKKKINELEGGIVYSYWLNAIPYALTKVNESESFKIISRAHRYDIYENLPSTFKFWPYRDETLKNISKVYSISEDGKKYLEDNYNIYNKVEISKLGVHDRHVLAKRSNEKTDVSIVSVSRIEPMKRVDFILNSIKEYALENKDKNITWVHFGDGTMMNTVKINLEKENVANLKVILKGYVKNVEIYEYYKEFPVDLFMNLSSSEGIPVSIMEAQSFGIPTIATNVGGSGEIVTKKTGVLLSENPTKQEVKTAMERLLSKSISSSTIKDEWMKNFNADINYRDFAKRISNL